MNAYDTLIRSKADHTSALRLEAGDTPTPQWVAHVKQDGDSEYNYEASVCWGKPGASWGWFGQPNYDLI